MKAYVGKKETPEEKKGWPNRYWGNIGILVNYAKPHGAFKEIL